MKKIIAIICIITVILCIIIFNIFNYFSKSDIIDEKELIDEEKFTQDYLEKEKICLKFIKESMSSKSGGIHTNYLENHKIEEMASGHEILSESEGLIMLYYVEIQDKDEFDKHFNIVKNKMIDKTGLVKWRIKEDNYDIAISNATIDDLRIIRALIYAYDIWKDKEYYKTLKKISEALLKYNIYEDCLNNYLDMEYKHKSEEIDAAYIDLYTIKLLSSINNKWDKVYNKGLNIINKGYISNKFPLYQKTYNISKDRYQKRKVINSIDAFLVVLHLSEVGLVKNETIEWIRDQMKDDGRIYGEYDIKTGTPAGNVESTATYAIAARIAKVIGDEALYKALINRMLYLQVGDKSSPLYGGFGDVDTLKVYSFDNLQALLALNFRRIK
ncbi:glycosyl hydrolase family 8 [Paramaledivibacter caminithermalis]|jgi:endo-1,4-beta-D-glucanase Y|uniref:Endo-1,4-beta-D-glucanase Y n=1 Tax=Paramaledivibacter caminithermalis (strain DSM 15212 / CIP 107654 / DViRD3) TaxID=1121301 RepID=A0A1M6PC58_PARC5|nr:glycosyl hydrolase family 8 [Paramaledivibacter caminithermalis]SHK05507.1 Endo-1,4-beta-D-glucanase Y [Paramaledivibacter caminithermalis DSM 15212]